MYLNNLSYVIRSIHPEITCIFHEEEEEEEGGGGGGGRLAQFPIQS